MKRKPKMMKGRAAAERVGRAVDKMPPGMRMGKKPKLTGAPAQYEPSTKKSMAEENTARPSAGRPIATMSPEPKMAMMGMGDTNRQARRMVKTARS